MPAMPVIPLITRCTLNWTNILAPAMHNVLHFAGQSGTEAERCDAFVAGLAAGALDYVSSAYSLTSIDFLPLDGTSPTVEASPAAPVPGGGGGDFIAEGCCILSLHTALRGPAHRGRIFLPALPENGQSGGTLEDAANMETEWNATLANWDGSTAIGELVVASYVHATAQVVSSIHVPQVIGTQRGRLVRLR